MCCAVPDLSQGGSMARGDKKPWVALAGDGQFHAMMLKPKSEDVHDWTYVMSSFRNEKL
jgi:hypothetical protein